MHCMIAASREMSDEPKKVGRNLFSYFRLPDIYKMEYVLYVLLTS